MRLVFPNEFSVLIRIRIIVSIGLLRIGLFFVLKIYISKLFCNVDSKVFPEICHNNE